MKIRASLRGQPLQADLVSVAKAFGDLQQARHEADYDISRKFSRQETIDLIEQTINAFQAWQNVRRSLQADVFLVALLAQPQMRV